MKHFCRTEQPDNTVRLCFIRIREFIKTINRTVPENYRCEKPAVFRDSDFSIPFLSSSETERLNKFKTLKKQVEWLSGRYAVKTLVTSENPAVEMSEIKVSHYENGAPFLKRFPDFNISISHSGNIAAAALSIDRDLEIGIDVERIKSENLEEILSVGFSDMERKKIAGCGPEAVYRAWTVKESFMKLIRKGFGESLKRIEFIDDKIIYYGRRAGDITLYTRKVDGSYAFALITRR